MTCLKCGRESEQTFCEECRAVMDKYPIKPGTIVQLPKERRSTPKRQELDWTGSKLESQAKNTKKTIRMLWVVIIAQLVLILAMGAMIFHLVVNQGVRPVGQNYSTVTTQAAEIEDMTE